MPVQLVIARFGKDQALARGLHVPLLDDLPEFFRLAMMVTE